MSLEPLQILATTVAQTYYDDNLPAELQDWNSSSSDDQKTYRCTEEGCVREFSSKRNLVDHWRGHHQGSKPHTCEYPGCGKSFLRPAHLVIHNRIHTGEKPFVCSYEGCGKRWNQKSALKQHLRSHTGEKPFICTQDGCGKKFSTSSSCKRHILTHEKKLCSAPSSPLFIDVVPEKKRKTPCETFESCSLSNKRFASTQGDCCAPFQEPSEFKMAFNFILN